MQTADWAFVISILSLCLSLASLAWNIWSKFIYPKPSFVVHFAVMQLFDQDGLHDPFLNLSVTNHGPIAGTITHSFVQARQGWKRSLGLIQPLSSSPGDPPISEGPFTGLPKKIEIGEEFSLKCWYGQNWLEQNVLRVGVQDSFGRRHWCPRADVREVKRQYEKDKAEGKLPPPLPD